MKAQFNDNAKKSARRLSVLQRQDAQWQPEDFTKIKELATGIADKLEAVDRDLDRLNLEFKDAYFGAKWPLVSV